MSPRPRRAQVLEAFRADLKARGLAVVAEWLHSVGPKVGCSEAEIDEAERVICAIEVQAQALLAMIDRDVEAAAAVAEIAADHDDRT